MSVAKRTWTKPNGEIGTAWVVRYYDMDGKYRTKTFKVFREAKEWEIQTKVGLKKGVHRPDSTSPTVRDAAAEWLKRAEAEDLERSTIASYSLHWRVHIEPAISPVEHRNGWVGKFGDVKLSRLTTPMCVVFQRLIASKNNRPNASKILVSFKAILKEAQTQGWLAYNPAAGVRMSQKDRDRMPVQIGENIPRKEDVRAILAASSSRWRPFFFTAAFTGMRASELRGLTWSHVDFDKRVIRVRQRADFKGTIGACKSRSGYRDIQMSDALVEVLLEWKERCPKGPLDLVFPNMSGRVEYHSIILDKAWYPTLRCVGLIVGKKAKYRLHGLRHFFVSLMIELGMPPKRLQETIGHASIKMTMDVYGHLFPAGEEELERANRAVDTVLEAANDNFDQKDDTG